MDVIEYLPRMRHKCGRSWREAVRACDLSSGAVNQLQQRAESAGLGWSLPTVLAVGRLRAAIPAAVWMVPDCTGRRGDAQAVQPARELGSAAAVTGVPRDAAGRMQVQPELRAVREVEGATVAGDSVGAIGRGKAVRGLRRADGSKARRGVRGAGRRRESHNLPPAPLRRAASSSRLACRNRRVQIVNAFKRRSTLTGFGGSHGRLPPVTMLHSMAPKLYKSVHGPICPSATCSSAAHPSVFGAIDGLCSATACFAAPTSISTGRLSAIRTEVSAGLMFRWITRARCVGAKLKCPLFSKAKVSGSPGGPRDGPLCCNRPLHRGQLMPKENLGGFGGQHPPSCWQAYRRWPHNAYPARFVAGA